MKLYMYQTVSLFIIRSFSLYTQQWYVSYRFAVASCQQTCMTYTIAVCTLRNSWWRKRDCPKHVEFHSKNKFEKLIHLVGFIIGMLSRYTVTWTSNTKPCLYSDCYLLLLLLSFYDTSNPKDYITLYSYNNVDSNSGHSELNCRMISEEWIVKDMEGSSDGLVLEFAGRNYVESRKPQ
jgi:hypothetical protein